MRGAAVAMAGLWAVALACYITGIYLAARRPRDQPLTVRSTSRRKKGASA